MTSIKKKLLILAILEWGILNAQPHPSATLTWSWVQSGGDPATGFHVLRATTTGGPYVLMGTTPANMLSYIDTAVQSGTTYFYVVTAFNSAGDSPRSNEVACLPPFQIPGAPTGLSGTVK